MLNHNIKQATAAPQPKNEANKEWADGSQDKCQKTFYADFHIFSLTQNKLCCINLLIMKGKTEYYIKYCLTRTCLH